MRRGVDQPLVCPISGDEEGFSLQSPQVGIHSHWSPSTRAEGVLPKPPVLGQIPITPDAGIQARPQSTTGAPQRGSPRTGTTDRSVPPPTGRTGKYCNNPETTRSALINHENTPDRDNSDTGNRTPPPSNRRPADTTWPSSFHSSLRDHRGTQTDRDTLSAFGGTRSPSPTVV